MPGVVAVHCGAGSHNSSLFKDYKKLCNRACEKAAKVLEDGGSAVDAVKVAVVVLENDPLTNCGYGSNLTSDGTVENDASIMDGKTLNFGACGAVKKVKNPVELAYCLCVNQSNSMPLGLIPPSLLVGQGGLDYARNVGLKIVKHNDLISAKATKQFNQYSKLLEAHQKDLLLDTVGAVCIDGSGHVAAACSSGGILLKKPGRVGQAAIFASGSWADSTDKEKESSIAVCTTGCGEHLIQTQLAKEISVDLKHTTCPTVDLHKSMNEKFLLSKFLRNVQNKMGGALVLHRDYLTGDIGVMWGHSTETMVVGYMGAGDKKPKCQFSVLPKHVQAGTAVIVGGSKFYTIDNSSKIS
ncbi:unnamed protein product [Phyllotreta striolata]|uniref:Threonine aspartase 1 n=1 Tax=Phyllotreta striolata TaxID=444603 RepID=A0A9N9TUW1_PHYSR|nr:unnamed protein product [Phyllotreta striolata]